MKMGRAQALGGTMKWLKSVRLIPLQAFALPSVAVQHFEEENTRKYSEISK
jgi:hypothetical protein